MSADDEDEKFKKLLIASIGHLVGLKTESNGRLEPVADWLDGNRQRIRDEVRVENINKSIAQCWQAGAMLESASELGLLSDSKIESLRKKLNINTKPMRTVDSRQFGKTTGEVNGRRNLEPEGPCVGLRRSNAPSIVKKYPQHSSGFLPPRQAETSNSQTGEFHSKEKVELKRKGTEPSSSNALFGAVLPNKKPNVQHQLGNDSNSTANQVEPASEPAFKTALDALAIRDKQRGIQRKFSTPASTDNPSGSGLNKAVRKPENAAPRRKSDDPEESEMSPEVQEIMAHESMKNIDPKMVEAIINEVVQIASTNWDDIAGLTEVKSIIKEIIIWPLLRPDIFKGLRASPRGILFFGPPGTGKTMFGRLIASQSQSTFFNISASALTSKWVGEGEKMVRTLFCVARVKQPAVIFIDEIDSILTQRSDTEHESSRRLKTEFLIQFDGCATQGEERILVIGVTNRPQELDEAARRRFVKRVYIPLPDFEGRKQLVKNLLRQDVVKISEEDYNEIANLTAGYSGADMACVCREAAYGPIREVGHLLQDLHASQVRPMEMKDFLAALRQVKSSVAETDVDTYKDWDAQYGCHL